MRLTRSMLRPLLPALLLVCPAAGALQAQSGTAVEVGVSGVRMRRHDGWADPVGIGGQIGIRRGVAKRLEARLGVTGFHRRPGESGIRITTVGLTAELATPLAPSGKVLAGGGVGLFAVDMYQRGFDDAVRVSTGAIALAASLGTRHALGGGTIDVRLRMLYGDLGETGRTTVMIGAVLSP